MNFLGSHFKGFVPANANYKDFILFDGHKSYISLMNGEVKIILCFVLLSTTSYITQHLHVGVLPCSKRICRMECMIFLREHPGQQITKHHIAKLASSAYLKALTPANLVNTFRKIENPA